MNKRIWRIAACFILLTGLTGFAVLIFGNGKPPLMQEISFSAAYYDADGKLLRLSLSEDDSYRLYTKLEDISDDLIKASLLQEDRYFYMHPGVNPVSLLRGAFATYIQRSRPVGGSTITMQVVRLRDNLYTRNLPGKLTQIIRAMRLEAYYSKKEILEAYLNLAPYGGNIYGAGTAAQIYFKQDVKNLAMLQSMALAVIPQNPVKRFPLRENNQPWHDARKRLLSQLPAKQQQVHMPYAEMKLTAYGRDDIAFHAPHLLDFLAEQGAQGQVDTVLDSQMQELLEARLQEYLARHKASGFDNAAAMLLHFPTMEVKALVGSADFYDPQIAGQVDGTRARRSPGSALKPFTYALALEQGLIHPETLLEDDRSFYAEYRPGNFDKRFIGKIPAREALVLSRNIPAIALTQKLKEPSLYEFLQKAGAGFPEGEGYYGLALVVGGAEITMRKMVSLYAMLANGGLLQDLKYTKDQGDKRPERLLSPEAALLTLNMLERPSPDRLPFMTGAVDTDLPVYWKTGTSNGFRDAWTVGVFGPYVMAVWLGHFDGHANPSLVGAEAAVPLFFDLVQNISARERLSDLIMPALNQADLARVDVCIHSGVIGKCGLNKQSLFIPGKSPFQISVEQERTEILSPREHVSYSQSYGKDDLYIPLEAKSAAAGDLYWFANNQYLGRAANNTPLFWQPRPGEHVLRVVDTAGHTDSRVIHVILSE